VYILRFKKIKKLKLNDRRKQEVDGKKVSFLRSRSRVLWKCTCPTFVAAKLQPGELARFFACKNAT
jgi:hypothetical protein